MKKIILAISFCFIFITMAFSFKTTLPMGYPNWGSLKEIKQQVYLTLEDNRGLENADPEELEYTCCNWGKQLFGSKTNFYDLLKGMTKNCLEASGYKVVFDNPNNDLPTVILKINKTSLLGYIVYLYQIDLEINLLDPDGNLIYKNYTFNNTAMDSNSISDFYRINKLFKSSFDLYEMFQSSDFELAINGQSRKTDQGWVRLEYEPTDLYEIPLDIPELQGRSKGEIEFFDLGFEDLKEISNLDDFANLKYFDASLTDLTTISGLDKLSSLKTLNLELNDIKEIKNLDSLTQLEKLMLSNCKITELKNLNLLTKLKLLTLAYNKIKDFQNLKYHPELTYLDLSGNKISHISALPALPELKILLLTANRLKKLENIPDLPSLTTLALNRNSFSKIDAGFRKLEQLVYLDLSRNSFGKLDCSLLPQNLEVLLLKDQDLESLSNLNYLTKLKKLNLHDTDIRELGNVDGLSNLEYLDLSDTNISVLRKIGKLKSLKTIKMDKRQIRKFDQESYDLIEKNQVNFIIRGEGVKTDITYTFAEYVKNNKPKILKK
ncbi:MAG: hypothetical protein MJB14_07335 [Spirochaetes bacterium]|nr:hypothetical protein [Spirochaetota bacterium]